MISIKTESTKSRIILDIEGYNDTLVIQRAFYKNKTWKTLTSNGFVVSSTEASVIPLAVNSGVFIDSFDLEDGLYEYRVIPFIKYANANGNDWTYSEWVKYGLPSAIGYSFNNYSSPEGEFGEIVTPDDMRYSYLWGVDLKSTNGNYFEDTQIKWFIDAATKYLERELNITIKKRVIRSQAKDRNLVKTTRTKIGDYDDEESLYDFSWRKIQRYGMIKTKQRPIIEVTRCELVMKTGNNFDLLGNMAINRKQGIIKYLTRPFKPNQMYRGISDAIGRYGSETFEPHLFYAIDYTAGYENSDEIPDDLREIIAKCAAISLLNAIGDGLMAGFSSSSLSMDGISESFSSTQSATSAYFGARIAVYQKELKEYIEENKYKFSNAPMGAL